MKNLKSLIAMSLFLLLSSNFINAQERQKLSDEQKEIFVAQLKQDKDRLALTSSQEESFKEITKKYATKLKDLKDNTASRKDKFQQLKEIQSQKNAEMKTLLSEKQYATFLEIQGERKEKMKERRKQ